MPARTLGKISDDILAKSLEIKAANAVVEKLEKERDVLEEELRLAAEKEGLVMGGGGKSKWSITPDVIPQVQNWDDFHKFILKKKWLHLLQRRPTIAACRELWEQNIKIPGVEKFSRNKVSVREV